MRDPELDGVDHINIYSQAKTDLGRLLSNFANTPIDYEPYGRFESIEGLWFWLLTGDDRLKEMHGYGAKKLGESLPWHRVEGFREIIQVGLRLKVEQHPFIAKSLVTNVLPFDHYYCYGGKAVDAGYSWLVESWEEIALEVKAICMNR